MTPAAALAELAALGDTRKAAEMAAYHKVERPYFGVANPVIDGLAKTWRGEDLAARLRLAEGLWNTNVHEARIAGAKLLTQARIRPDDSAAWDLIVSWVPDFDAWAIADHAAIAGQKRLVWNPNRIETVEAWTASDHMWSRRAALVMTLPWARLRNPKPGEIIVRDRVLGWAAGYVSDRDWFIQKAVAWWLRDLSKRWPDVAKAFLEDHGAEMKPFARREAARYLD